MSERDFEVYLALLGKMLRLSPKQRASIEAELRAHLEDRYDELIDRGYEKQDAIDSILEEFGDAASLASRFSLVNQLQRRKLIMRYSFASLCVLAIVASAILSVLPEHGELPVQRAAVAQNTNQSGGQDAAGAAETEPEEAEEPGAALNEALAGLSTMERLAMPLQREMDYKDAFFEEVIGELRAELGVDIYVNWKRLASAHTSRSRGRGGYLAGPGAAFPGGGGGLGGPGGPSVSRGTERAEAKEDGQIGIDSFVNLRLKATTYENALTLILGQVGDGLIDYVIRDEVIVISTREELAEMNEVRMYEVHDLVGLAEATDGRSLEDLNIEYIERKEERDLQSNLVYTLRAELSRLVESLERGSSPFVGRGGVVPDSPEEKEKFQERRSVLEQGLQVELQKSRELLRQVYRLEQEMNRPRLAATAGQRLVMLIENHLSMGGERTISYHDGMLILKADTALHREVTNLLKKLRDAETTFFEPHSLSSSKPRGGNFGAGGFEPAFGGNQQPGFGGGLPGGPGGGPSGGR